MLFRKKTVNEKIEHLVKKNDFYELADYVHDNDEDVIFAACESLRKVGCEHNTADLLEKLNKIPKEDEKVREEISRTVQELHHRL